MISLLDDIAVFHNKDQIRISDRGETMCNDKAGSSLHQVIHGFLAKFLFGQLRFCDLLVNFTVLQRFKLVRQPLFYTFFDSRRMLSFHQPTIFPLSISTVVSHSAAMSSRLWLARRIVFPSSFNFKNSCRISCTP